MFRVFFILSFLVHFTANGKINKIDPLKYLKDREFSSYVMNCGEKVELLDYFELFNVEDKYQYTVDGTDEFDVLEKLLNRVEEISLPRATLFRFWMPHIKDNIKFFKGINFGPLKDEFDFTIWKNCKVETLSKALNPLDKGKGLFVERKLWDKMDKYSRAGFYLNYLINLEHSIYNKNKNTVYSRFLNALIASDKYFYFTKTLNKASLFKKLNFPVFFHRGAFYSTHKLMVDESDNVIYGSIASSPRLFRYLNIKSIVKIENIKNLSFELLDFHALDLRSSDNFRFKNVRVLSKCFGRFKFPDNADFITNGYIRDGKFYVEEVSSFYFRYKGRYVEKIVFNNDKASIFYRPNNDSPGWPPQDLTDCHVEQD